MDIEKFMKILQVNEEYEIQNKLMNVLLSDKKNIFLDELINNGFDIEKDCIREMFENELANRKTLKQDYTPYSICKLISLITGKHEEILDVCSGVGSLAIQNSLDNDTDMFVCEEISTLSISMLLLNISIRNINATIYRKDVLTQEVFETYELKKEKKYSSIEKIENIAEQRKYKCIISNPPYSMKWDAINDERFWGYGVAPKTKADYAFVLDILYRLELNGNAFIILPHGVLFRGGAEETIRKALIHDNVIDAVISLPEKMFVNTQIPVIILCLKKGKTYKDVLFIDSSREYEKQGKNNILSKEHLKKIIETYKKRADIDKYSRKVDFDEIAKNDFNLNVPRYIDTFDKKEPIDLPRAIDEIVEIEDEIHRIDKELAKMFGQLQGDDVYECEKIKIIEYLNSRYIHDASSILEKIYNYINKNKQLAKHKRVNLLDLVEIERSKKNKVYKNGSILIQLSATRGQMGYLDNDKTVESKYGVMTVKNDCINSKYLYYMLQMNIENFLRVYQTGLNIVPDVFKFMKLEIHTDKTIQDEITVMFTKLETVEKTYLKEIEKWKDIKSYHLDNMFV